MKLVQLPILQSAVARVQYCNVTLPFKFAVSYCTLPAFTEMIKPVT